jgi:nitrilase
VLVVGLMMPTLDIPSELPHQIQNMWIERGGSAIVAPDASYLIQPIYDREDLLIADLDLTMIDKESMGLDVTGHYSRVDVFGFSHRVVSLTAVSLIKVQLLP